MESAFPGYIRTRAHAWRRWLTFHPQSVCGYRLHTPAQTGEEQTNQCYLDEGFTRLYFSLVILA